MDTTKEQKQTNQETATSSIQQPPRIGELLLRHGYIKQKELENALAVQKEEKTLSKLPLGEILVKMGVLSQEELADVLNDPALRKKIGSLAVEKGLIKNEDLQSCLKSKKPGEFIGKTLVDSGILAHKDLKELLKQQIDSPKLGESLIDQKRIAEKDLQLALRAQKSPRALGEILCDLNFISPHDLNYILEKYKKQVEIQDVLRKLGHIDDIIINEAKKEQAKTSESIEQILLRKKHITEKQLRSALSRKYNLPFLHLNDFSYSQEDKTKLSRLISQKYAENNLILPISFENKKLTIGISRPDDSSFVRELKNLYPHLEISLVLITGEKFGELFEILYSKRLATASTSEESEPAEDIDFMEIDLDENIADKDDKEPTYAQVDFEAEEIVNFIIKYGILNNASDIHIEQDRHGCKLRYRIDGILQEPNITWLKRKLSEKIGSIISRIKVMSDLDIAERRLPQDGVFRINYYDKATQQKFDLDFRVATCRAIVGENVAVRILDSRKANIGLDKLNISPHVLKPFKSLLRSSAGMILVSGPTGSGKSSTLYGALQYIYNPGVKIITAEDPIEYSFPGVMQSQIHPKIGITFSRLLRSFLRFDPDIILLGEMRDEETASIGFDAAQTGHLMLSTIHTNDSIGAITRLADLNIEHNQIASCILAVLAQRLVRKICSFCKTEYIPGEDELEIIFQEYPSHLKFYKGEGCESCNFSGYKGRTLISEIFIIDKEIGLAIGKGFNDTQIKNIATQAGMKTMLEDGLMKMEETTLSEILRVIPHDMIEFFKKQQHSQKEAGNIINTYVDKTDNAAGKHLSPQAYIISDPLEQEQTVTEMFQYYNTINGTHPNATEADFPLYKEFITESFHTICREYNCRSLSFTIQNKNGVPELSVSPVT